MKSILIVDDEKEIIEMLDELLSPDYRLHYALSGEKAFEVFKQKKSDLIITDVSMPNYDGTQLISDIRKISQVPVIAVSGIDRGKLEAATNCGANATLSKPFSIGKLLETVHLLLDGGEPSAI